MKFSVGICKDLIDNIADDTKHALDQVLERDSASKAKKKNKNGSHDGGGLFGSLTGGLGGLTGGLDSLTGGLTGGLGSLGGLASAGSTATSMSTIEALAVLPGQLAEISRLLAILLSALETEDRDAPLRRVRLVARFLAVRRRLRQVRRSRVPGADL